MLILINFINLIDILNNNINKNNYLEKKYLFKINNFDFFKRYII